MYEKSRTVHGKSCVYVWSTKEERLRYRSMCSSLNKYVVSREFHENCAGCAVDLIGNPTICCTSCHTGSFAFFILTWQTMLGIHGGGTRTLIAGARQSVVQNCRYCRRQSTTNKGKEVAGIYNPPSYQQYDKEIFKSIRCCITGVNQDDHEHYTKDTGMSICFLGTGAGIPTRQRSTTSTLLRLGGSSMLFDAGEGVQRQLAFTRARPSHVERIFITHLHGDHIFGLPGLLLGLQLSIMSIKSDDTISKRKQQKKDDHVVKIYGPRTYSSSNICLNALLFCLPTFCSPQPVSTTTLHPTLSCLALRSRVRRVHGDKSSGVKNPFEDTYPEFNYGLLKRRYIEPENGVWKIEDIEERTRRSVLGNERPKSRQIRIQAAELDHLSGVVTFGYVIEEEEPPRNVDPNKAKELGILPIGNKFDLLKHGFSVQNEDGSRTVQPEEVWKEIKQRARKITITGDNRGWTPQMRDIAKNSDVLLHEATLMNEEYNHGHSTAAMAGKVSGDVNASLLVLNHISSKSDRKDSTGNSFQLRLIDNARKSSGGKSDVIVAYDFMELLVPRLGFSKVDQQAEVSSTSQVLHGAEDSEKTVVQSVVKEWFEKKEEGN
eukprot:scaffold1319_cov126-Cylindrotheca_fusiformis.AAC.37